jgi:protein-tyrosine phosphatase
LLRAAVTRVRALVAVWTARGSTRANLERSVARRILVLCYGNIYRSPFVAKLLANRLDPRTEVRSAGFHAVARRPSPARHVTMCRKYGVALDDHRSAVATADDVAWADLIVLMDRHNWLMSMRLGAKPEQIVWLGALIPGPVDIADPYQLTDEQAAHVIARLQAGSEVLIVALSGRHLAN